METFALKLGCKKRRLLLAVRPFVNILSTVKIKKYNRNIIRN